MAAQADDGVAAHEDARQPQAVALGDAVERLSTALEDLARVEPHDLPSAHLLSVVRDLEEAARRLSGIQARVFAAVETDGLWATGGARSFASWVRTETGASAPRATAVARSARALRDHLPLAAAALGEGRITAEHAQILARHVTSTQARITALGNPEVGEAFLVDAATRMDASDFSRVVRAWSVGADPESADREYASDLDREELVLARAFRGWHLQGWLEDSDGGVLAAALDAYTGAPAAGDTRTTAQRRAAALVALARMALDSGALQPGASIRPHLSVHVTHPTLLALADAQAPQEAGPGAEGIPSDPSRPGAADDPRPQPGGCSLEPDPEGAVVVTGGLDYVHMTGRAPAELDDGTPIPPALLARLACDGELARVIFGPASEVLDVGRAKRLFPPGQRRAVIARDRCCQFPGCDAPPGQGEIHHSIWWYAQHGSTRAADGVLLCWFHHAFVHAHAIEIVRSSADAAARAGLVGQDGDAAAALPLPALSPPRAADVSARGVGEHGAGEHGAGEHGAGEHRAGEHGAGEHGAGQRSAGERSHMGTAARSVAARDQPRWRFYRRNGAEITGSTARGRPVLRASA